SGASFIALQSSQLKRAGDALPRHAYSQSVLAGQNTPPILRASAVNPGKQFLLLSATDEDNRWSASAQALPFWALANINVAMAGQLHKARGDLVVPYQGPYIRDEYIHRIFFRVYEQPSRVPGQFLSNYGQLRQWMSRHGLIGEAARNGGKMSELLMTAVRKRPNSSVSVASSPLDPFTFITIDKGVGMNKVMSVEIQKQIKDNATSVSDFFSDLYKWTEDQVKEEHRREIRKTAQQVGVQEAQKLLAAKSVQQDGVPPTPAPNSDSERLDPIKRDGAPIAQYYHTWDRYDPEAEVERIEDQAFQTQRAEKEARQAEKDRILDEMALQPNGDRTRTSTAKPRVKVSVRRSGRKVAPVDLAAPRKDEANRLFAAGRYREAIAAYTAAIDCLDKYEPAVGTAGSRQGDSGDRVQEADCAGEEKEAIMLKVALLANRALACLKLEDWRECVLDASEALRFEPMHHKAVLRRGFALARMKRWGPASKDLEHAVNADPGDKKAVAELQMVRRMLAEQAKDARAHAKCVMSDSTRSAAMPTRKLVVKVRAKPTKLKEAMQEVEPAKPEAVPPGVLEPSGPATVPSPSPSTRTYVPRSVRMRRQPITEAGLSGRQVASGRSMSFYQFEAQWARSLPRERNALLRKLGAASLPALFRESLDSELVASIVEALDIDLSEGQAPSSQFAIEVLGALSRTLRFELSLQSLTASERDKLDEVLKTLRANASPQEMAQLDEAYRPSATSASQPNVEDVDEDDVPDAAEQ
ncbi:RPAP3, partial [Symbiodinium pilosum]